MILLELYIRKADGFIVMYDTTDEDSLYSIDKYYQKIYSIKEVKKAAIVIAGSKLDVGNKKYIAEAKEYAKSRNVPHIETSAKEMFNVDEVFEALVLEIRSGVHIYKLWEQLKSGKEIIIMKGDKPCIII